MVETLGNIMQTRPYFNSDKNEDENGELSTSSYRSKATTGKHDKEDEEEEAISGSIGGRINPLGPADVELNVVAEDC